MRCTLLACLLVAAGCTDQTYRFDFDEDGWEDRQDCDPADPDIHPEANDPVGDDIDQDCDGADGTAVPAVAISPTSPGTNDVLFLQVVTEAPSWSIVWSLDGEAQAAWNGQSVIPAEVTERGQTWTVEVTTVSALGTETAAAEASVEIVNTPPVATLALGLPRPRGHRAAPLRVDGGRTAVRHRADADRPELRQARRDPVPGHPGGQRGDRPHTTEPPAAGGQRRPRAVAGLVGADRPHRGDRPERGGHRLLRR